ncbi:MAG: MBL fold metallo-hydrolase [Bacillota bacterium]
MQVTILGCWAPYPRAGGACSGYLIREGEWTLLLECGNGVMSKLQQKMNFRRLNGVVVSHLHADHSSDLPALHYALAGSLMDGSRTGKIPLYLPSQPGAEFARFAGYTNTFELKLLEPPVPPRANIGPFSLQWMLTVHKIPAFAVSISSAAGRMVFSSDTAWSPELVDFCSGAGLFLCEASVAEQHREYAATGHLTSRQAGQLAREARVSRCVLTHFWPEYDLGHIRREAEAEYGSSLELAQEGLTYQVLG